MVIKQPLIRLKIHKKKLTRCFILGVYFLSYILTSYTPFISGLLLSDNKESENKDDFLEKYECDTKLEYKSSYEYIALVYINTGIIIPIIILSFLNTCIIYVLSTKKNEKFRQNFSSKPRNQSIYFKSSLNSNKKSIKKLSASCELVSLNQDNKKINKMMAKSENLKMGLSSIENLKANSFQKIKSFEEDAIKLNHFSLKKIVKEKSFSVQQISKSSSTISKSFKESDRSTLILIILSVIFVLLNFPYICSW